MTQFNAETSQSCVAGRSKLGTGARRWTTDALFDRSGLQSNVVGKCSSLVAEMAAPAMAEATMFEALMDGHGERPCP